MNHLPHLQRKWVHDELLGSDSSLPVYLSPDPSSDWDPWGRLVRVHVPSDPQSLRTDTPVTPGLFPVSLSVGSGGFDVAALPMEGSGPYPEPVPRGTSRGVGWTGGRGHPSTPTQEASPGGTSVSTTGT